MTHLYRIHPSRAEENSNDEESLYNAESAHGPVEQTIDTVLDIARDDVVSLPTDALRDENVEVALEILPQSGRGRLLCGSTL